ncbi:alpha/beta hydrolase [Pseudonocardia ailaonensis]|uniref:Alpha/beta hydrolase n=1 Tax=Pseudonocardia ailaonensis TaxID=367279 RepID=A0ABN2NHW6_9PSEU
MGSTTQDRGRNPVPLHPDALALVTRATSGPLVHTMPVERARVFAEGAREGLDAGCSVPDVSDLGIVRAGGPTVPVRLFRPRHGQESEVVVWCHGGGWALMRGADADACVTRLASRTGSAVLNVDYRLAPEDPFPAALTDLCAVIEWAAARWPRVVVGGDSAGGNLAAAAALRFRDEGTVRLAAQLLVYPVVDHDFTTASYAQFETGLSTTRVTMQWYWDMYLPDPAARDDPLASPLRAATHAGLPPTVLVVAGHDPLRTEVLAYGERLRAAGNRIERLDFPDMHHGFFTIPGRLDRAGEAIDLAARSLRGLLDG